MPVSRLVLDGIAARGSHTIYHLTKRTEGKAVLLQEFEASILQENFLGIQTFLAREQDHVHMGVDVPHPLERIQTVHLTIQVIIQDDDGRMLVQLGNTRFPIGVKMNVAAQRLQFLCYQTLIDDVILDDEDHRLWVKFHD